jgi:hypothetical protein
MNMRSSMWLVLRISFTLLPIVGSLTHPGGNLINLGWASSILVSAALAVVIFGWLCFITKYTTVHLEEPFSLTLPFYPMAMYPLRFLLLGSATGISAGTSRMLVSFFTHREITGTLFLFLGIGMLVAVLSWMRWARRQ